MRKKQPFRDRVKSTLPVIVAKARRHEFHANAPYYGEEELATDIDPGDRALLIKEAALAASFLKAHAKADKINVGASATWFASSICMLWRGLSAIPPGPVRSGDRARRSVMTSRRRGRWSRRRRRGWGRTTAPAQAGLKLSGTAL